MEEYEFMATIGEGAYGAVWQCRARSSGRIVAVKGFKEAHIEPEILKLALREVRVLQRLDHPAVVKLLDAFKSKTGRVYMVFPYVGPSALQTLDEHPVGLPGTTLKLLAWQMLQALAYLHGRKVVHRDVKPANILMRGDGVAVLCDFGFARKTHCSERDSQALSPYVVTRWYRSPEVLLGQEYGPANDIWSLGCTLAELTTGLPLFQGATAVGGRSGVLSADGTVVDSSAASAAGPIAPPRVRRSPAVGRCSVDAQGPLAAASGGCGAAGVIAPMALGPSAGSSCALEGTPFGTPNAIAMYDGKAAAGSGMGGTYVCCKALARELASGGAASEHSSVTSMSLSLHLRPCDTAAFDISASTLDHAKARAGPPAPGVSRPAGGAAAAAAAAQPPPISMCSETLDMLGSPARFVHALFRSVAPLREACSPARLGTTASPHLDRTGGRGGRAGAGCGAGGTTRGSELTGLQKRKEAKSSALKGLLRSVSKAFSSFGNR
ncbi:hypothetical protein GPECTOR_21g743 [Gonium pectorale]|uniref:cyclin-dependent kinase n=1 Tax=Gonium pectorale TaxID=33097 RepID=A0A150GI73_GONPE|nr:hypothetical protein GPECTOR_21g743 [Gonium pectorale]|eukprot:KXZ49517.1 hypothetical protein GPECTOR_21g743 [Gonium pectorale]